MFDKKALEVLCQSNPWLKRGGYEFEPEGFCCESDYPYSFYTCSTLEELREKFIHGNWGIRQGFMYESLCFINQVNGGDEWWTIKAFGNKLVPFESITFRYMVRKTEEFEAYMKRLLNATEEQCKKLEY